MGNLTRDPTLSSLPSGDAVCEFGMAINETWRDKNTNEKRERVCFVDLRAYKRTAETINQYMSKGKPLHIEGRLRLDQWEAKDGGGKRSKLYVVVDNFTFVGSKGDYDDGGRADPPPTNADGESMTGGNIPF